MPCVLEIRDLVTAFRRRRSQVRVVDGLSLRVDAGETVGLVGESGCGKTMAALSIMRLLPPGGHVVSGEILISGRDILPLPERSVRRLRGSEVAMVFQDPMTSLTPTMTVGRQVAEAAQVHLRCDRASATARAVEVLGLVGLPRPRERLHDYPHQLSGGQRQRVAIAMALACEPRVLIADEPTTALDVTIQAQILHLLDDLKQRLGMAVLLITHDMGVIAGRTDRVAVMYGARIVEEAATPDLFAHTRHPYTEALLQSIPAPGQDRDQPLRTIAGQPPDLANLPVGCRFAPRCGYASEVCRQQEPELVDENGSSSHRVACHHPVAVRRAREAAL